MTLRIAGGTLRGRRIMTSSTIRPTSEKLRQAFFNICQHSIQGSRFLDLFAGSGAMGLEAVSRGAKTATFVERDRKTLVVLRENIKSLGLESQCTVIPGDVQKAVGRLSEPFDTIYIDPPYGKGLGDETISLLDNTSILAENGSIYLEDTDYAGASLKHLQLTKKRSFGERYLFIFTPLS